MQLSEHQMTTVVHAVAAFSVDGFEMASPVEQARIKAEVMDWTLPLLLRLPEGVTGDQLLNYDDLIRLVAIEIIVKKLRRVQIYRDAAEAAILAAVPEEQVFLISRQVYSFGVKALEALPRDTALADIAASTLR